MTVDVVKTTLNESLEALQALIGNQAMLQRIAAAGQMLADTFAAGGRAYSCGNGGSMCDAMHFAEELTGRFRDNRPGYAALAISDASHLSCVGNDYGYEQVFARFLVKLLSARQLLEHHDKARLGAGFVDGLGQAGAQRIEILAARFGEIKVLADASADLLLGERIGAVGVQEVMTEAPGLLLQIANVKRANRLNKIWRHSHQQTHFFLKSTCQ